MNEKSYVSLEQHVCVVCGRGFDTGAILLDKLFHASMNHRTITGLGLCPEHQKLHDDGFVALVECDPRRSGVTDGTSSLQPDKAYRTGSILHMKREVFATVFQTELDPKLPCVFVEPGVIDQLMALSQAAK